MKNKTTPFLALLLVFISTTVPPTGINFEHGTLDSVLEIAKEQNKPVFIDAYATWCGPCKQMERKVFPDAALGTFFNENFISLKKNVEKGDGPKVQSKYKVRYLPTLLFVSPDGSVLAKVEGYHNAKQLLDVAKKAMKKHKSSN